MTAFVCPYCYSKLDDRALLFQCSGRVSPHGIRCEMTVDETRYLKTGYHKESHLVFEVPRSIFRNRRVAPCPSCGAVTGIRACPSCHTPLPASFSSSKNLLICLAGARGAGKSVYLTVLAHRLRHQLGRQFQASVTAVSLASYDDWSQNYDALFKARMLLPGTRPEDFGRKEPLVFHWRSRRTRLLGRHADCFMSYYDTAGEDFSTVESAHLLNYLAVGSALIILIDPLTIPQARDQIRHSKIDLISDERPVDVIARITEVLRNSHGVHGSRLIKIPVAIALTKFDLLFDVLGADHPLMFTAPDVPYYDETAGIRTHQQIRDLLRAWGADDIDRHIQLNFAEYRYFAISSLGSRPDTEVGSVNEQGVQPFRVDEPVTWLLSRFRIIGKIDGDST